MAQNANNAARAHTRDFQQPGVSLTRSLWHSNEKIICIKCGCCRLISPSAWQQRSGYIKSCGWGLTCLVTSRARQWKQFEKQLIRLLEQNTFIAGLAQRNLLTCGGVGLADQLVYALLFTFVWFACACVCNSTAAAVGMRPSRAFDLIYLQKADRLNVNSRRAVCCRVCASGYFRRDKWITRKWNTIGR